MRLAWQAMHGHRRCSSLTANTAGGSSTARRRRRIVQRMRCAVPSTASPPNRTSPCPHRARPKAAISRRDDRRAFRRNRWPQDGQPEVVLAVVVDDGFSGKVSFLGLRVRYIMGNDGRQRAFIDTECGARCVLAASGPVCRLNAWIRHSQAVNSRLVITDSLF